MSYPKEYRLIQDESGVRVLGDDGEEPFYLTCRMLAFQMMERYKPKQYVYLCESLDGYLKIGFSGDPYRRMNELGAALRHFIPCSIGHAQRHEKELHKIFSRWRVHGEWFDFGDETKRTSEVFKSLKTERDLGRWIADRKGTFSSKNRNPLDEIEKEIGFGKEGSALFMQLWESIKDNDQ